MEIRPILSAMWRNRTGSVLVALQIALTLAIVVNCLFLAATRTEFIGRETGIDTDNIVTLSSLGFGSKYDHATSLSDDLELLRSIPGVVAATSSNHIPLSGSGSASGFRASMEEDAPSVSANYFHFDHEAEQALGVNIVEGRGFYESEMISANSESLNRMPGQVVISRALAERLYPDVSALGKPVFNNLGESSTVVGIVELMFGTWVSWDNLDQVLWMPKQTSGPSVRYIVRVEPGQVDAMVPVLEEALANSNRNRLIRGVQTMPEVVARSYSMDRAMAILLSVATALLLMITGLGIIGLASFSVRQRTRQIGTRRAIGARKRDIIRYFLMENWLMTTIGIVIGTLLTIGLNYALSSLFDLERLNYWYLLLGMGLLWALGFVAVAEPSRRAAQISPAIATRNV